MHLMHQVPWEFYYEVLDVGIIAPLSHFEKPQYVNVQYINFPSKKIK